MKLPDPGTYVAIRYTKERPGGVIGEEGEIISISSDSVTLQFQPKRREGETENPKPVKSVVPKHEIMSVVKVNAR